MGRLGILLCCIFALYAPSATAAQQSPGATGPAVTFVVAGDVAQPDKYSAGPGAGVSLRSAVSGAGMISETANVLVIRNWENNGQWTQFISRSGTEPGPEIRSGDVLVVYAGGALERQLVPNSVFVDRHSAVVIALDHPIKTGITVGDILQHFPASNHSDLSLQIISGRPGRSTNEAAVAHDIQHGDVLVARASQIVPVGAQRGFSPQVSEWHSPGAMQATSASGTSALTSQNTGRSDQDAGELNGVPKSSVTSIPLSIPATPLMPAAEQQMVAASEQGSNRLSVTDTDPVSSNNVDIAEPDSTAIPQVGFASGAATLSDDPEQLHPASLQTFADDGEPGVRKALPISASTDDVAPLPPEKPQVVAETSAYTVWNMIFVVGLILAGVLIVGGWLKSEAEMRQMQSSSVQAVMQEYDVDVPSSGANLRAQQPDEATRLARQFNTLEEINASKLADSVGFKSPDGNQLSEASTDLHKNHAAADSQVDSKALHISGTGQDSSTLVREDEWFAGDWIPAVVSQNPVVPGAQDQFGAVIKSEAHRAIDQWSNVAITSDAAHELPCDKLKPVSGSQDVTPENIKQIADSDASLAETALADSGSAVPVAGIDQVVNQLASGFEELTDLIENRLPVDLCEARLPLRISLFGTPTGPRRLRIDAAHRQLAGPHMSMSTERRRKPPATITASHAISERNASEFDTTQQSTAADSIDKNDDVHSKGVSAASLDKALNYLNEQGM